MSELLLDIVSDRNIVY